MNTDVIILAAGKGSRMKSKLPKVLQPLAGQPLLAHVLHTAALLENASINIVIGHAAEQIETVFSDASVTWIRQLEQLGTGHAAQQALPVLDKRGVSLILYGDVPLIKRSTLETLIQTAEQGDIALLTVKLDNPSGYGRIIRDNAHCVTAIIEQKEASPEQLAIQEVNTGIMALPTESLHRYLPKLSNDNAQHEYYLTDIIAMANQENTRVSAYCLEDETEVAGINDKKQLADLERRYQLAVASELMDQGVTLSDPHRIDVRGFVSAGSDVSIDVNCVFKGMVELGDNVQIDANCIIGVIGKTTSIAANTHIKPNTIIEEAILGEFCEIGPYARLRPGTELANKVKIGNFVETKKVSIGLGSKVSHLSYIGDAALGEAVNIGAGTITCNYDGVNKHKTSIGDDVFVGSNTSIVAPVTIHDEATIAAGSTITQNVNEKALAVSRQRQKNIDNWPRPTKED